MAQPQRFDFDSAAVETPPPFHGRTSAAKHASFTGAASVVDCWTQRQSAYLQLLEVSESLTDHEAAALLKWPLSSVNSVRGSLGERIVSDGFDLHTFTNVNGQQRTTKRTRWTIARTA